MHAISSYRGNRPTNTQKPTDRSERSGERLASAQCKYGIQKYSLTECAQSIHNDVQNDEILKTILLMCYVCMCVSAQ